MLKVVIGTPVYDGRVALQYMDSLIKTIELAKENDIEIIPRFIVGNSIIQSARDDAFLLARKESPDCLIWIDSDMEWLPEMVVKFAKSDIDVLGAPYVKKSMKQSFALQVDLDTAKINGDLMEVKATGTGFLKMSRKAMDYLWDNSEPYEYKKIEKRSIFQVSIINGALTGEDYSVCKKLREGGFKIYVDIADTLSHVGTYKFTGNIKNMIRDQRNQPDVETEDLMKQLNLI